MSIMNKSPEQNFYYTQDIAEVLKQLNSQLEGLDENEAALRLKFYGPNALIAPKRRNFITRFFAQFNHLLIYVLLASALITAVLQHWIDMSVILGVVLINAVIGMIQEGKAEKSLGAIRQMLTLKTIVIRNGLRTSVSAETLVPGDIIFLKSGDKVPADMRLIDTKNLQIQESALTGESLAAEKSTFSVAEDAELGERTCMAYAGTWVTYGKALGIVVATGESTEVGKIGKAVSELPTLTTPLLQQINHFARWLTLIILIAASATFLFGILIHFYSSKEMFMAAVGLAVAAIPEGLPAIITITLAIGVTHMAKRHAIIRRLPAVETLGSINVICTDKTGTLTCNELIVQNIVTAQHEFYVSGTGYGDEGDFQLDQQIVEPGEFQDLQQIIRAAILCNDAELVKLNNQWQLHGNPVDGALLSLGLKAEFDLHLQKQNYPLTDLIPFESEHKFMATLHHDHKNQGYIYVKGAPEYILSICTKQLINGNQQPFVKNFWHKQIDLLAARGQRVIAIAMRHTSSQHRNLSFQDITSDFIFLGLFGLLDPPRKEAAAAIRECYRAGINVKMITGDYPATAKSIAKQIGIKNCVDVLRGHELEMLELEELKKLVPHIDIYARTSPQHKLKLVEALQSDNKIVAMTGDGVNDTPALKCANVGIAMGVRGTETAKETAEMILTDDNFASIVAAVKEGRTIYDNIWKSILFTLPTNAGEALMIIAAVLAGVILPISPVQILWINMVTEVTLGLALAFEQPEKKIMERPPRGSDHGLLSPLLIWRTLFVSLLMVASSFALFWWAYEIQQYSLYVARTITVNTIVFCEIAYLLNSRKTSSLFLNWNIFSGVIPATVAIILVVLLQLAFTYVPWMQEIFGTASINLLSWITIISIGAGLFVIVELEKLLSKKFIT